MLRCVYTQRRWAHRRGGFVTGGTGWSQKAGPVALMGAKKSEWWAVDGELHEIGEGVPHRERFAIPRDNLPNRRRKQMREQFMRRTRLVLKDSVICPANPHLPWLTCATYSFNPRSFICR
jgi:hypothetical protein